MSSQEINAHKAVDFILKKAPEYAKAKSERAYLEEFRKTKKALLMKDAMAKGIDSAVGQEREAYAHPEYQEVLVGMAAAIEAEETLKWQLEAARMRVEIYRTEEATNRMTMKSTS